MNANRFTQGAMQAAFGRIASATWIGLLAGGALLLTLFASAILLMLNIQRPLRSLVALFGPTQVMLGTDHPFNFHDRTPVGRVEAAFPSAAERDGLLFGNAARFLDRPFGLSA